MKKGNNTEYLRASFMKNVRARTIDVLLWVKSSVHTEPLIRTSQELTLYLCPISGNLLDESQVLEWMIEQRNDESIEDVDRETFLEYIDSKEFLAVVFCKSN